MSVTLESTALGDQVWTTSRGHTLTDAEARFTACDALVTPIVLDSGHCPDTVRPTCWPLPRAPAHGPAPATSGSAGAGPGHRCG